MYRVLRNKYGRSPFDGEGAYRYGGRWSSPGIHLSYTSEHQSLALLEYFVHLDKDDPPSDLVLAVAELPDDLSRLRIDLTDLLKNWRAPAAPPQLAEIGDEFVEREEQCVLLVPSVLAPSEYNWLINPAHPEFNRITILESQPMAYDSRLFGKSGRRQRH